MKFLPHAQRQNFVNQQLSDWISSKLDQELSPPHDFQWKTLRPQWKGSPSSTKKGSVHSLAESFATYT